MIDELKVALQTIWEELLQEHQQGGGKLHQTLNCLRGGRWRSFQASAVRVHFQVCIVMSAPENWLLHTTGENNQN